MAANERLPGAPHAGHERTGAAMRVSGGQARGIPLTVPRGSAVRPATDGMRQALFSSLGARVADAVFWDLFAGSGAYGLEALSRGALGGWFVERNSRAAEILRANLAAVMRCLGPRPLTVEVVCCDALTWLPPAGAAADLVFIDPPYELIPRAAPVLFDRLSAALAGKPDALVIFEMPGNLTLEPAGWTCAKRLGHGAHQPTVAIFRRG
jgi:16S rRNA (guanine966-N2)-methyltransferase